MTAKSVIVLAMHGMTPKDFPEAEKREFMRLKAQGDAAFKAQDANGKRARELEVKMRRWPRTAQNDPFFAAAQQLAVELERASASKVICGFNEFCVPSIPQAFEQAASLGVNEIVIVTPMMTRGGNHSEIEIPALIAAARDRFPQITFRYAWPFDPAKIASFLATQIRATAPSPS